MEGSEFQYYFTLCLDVVLSSRITPKVAINSNTIESSYGYSRIDPVKHSYIAFSISAFRGSPGEVSLVLFLGNSKVRSAFSE